MDFLCLLLYCYAAGATLLTAATNDSMKLPWKRHTIDNASKGADGIRTSDINRDGLIDLTTGWEEGGLVRVYLNPGPDKVKSPWPAVTVGRVNNVEDAVFADWDGDGIMDVVSSCEGNTRAMYVHRAPSALNDYMQPSKWQTIALPQSVQNMQWMFAIPLQVDGKYGTDLVAGGKGPDAAIGWFECPEKPWELSQWKWHPLRPAGWIMSLITCDMDDDKDMDVLFTDRKGKCSGAYWLENPGIDSSGNNWKEHLIGGDGRETMFMHVVDLDGDHLEDVLVATKPREILWFRRMDRTGLSWKTLTIPMPSVASTAKAVNAADIDLDGRIDLVFSCEGAKAPLQGLMWLKTTTPAQADSWKSMPISGLDGVKHDLIIINDLDHDGDFDIITTEEQKDQRGLGVIWYENPVIH